MKNICFLKCTLLGAILFLFTGASLASEQNIFKTDPQHKVDWIFKSLVRDAGNEHSVSETKSSDNCPQSEFLTYNFKPTFTFTKKFPSDEFSTYELTFDKTGQVINPATGALTNWYAELQQVKKNIARVVLKKKACSQEIEFGYYNTKTQRLCDEADKTLSSHRKLRANSKDFDACIDWAKYLNNPKVKEIDITIDSQDEFGNSPSSFLGFTRFKDVQKPIVGKDQSTWYCFANCKNGKAGKFERD
jgi:hypothetical protein